MAPRADGTFRARNRLKPAFVVITGDLINDPASAAQAAEYKRITAKLDPKIRLFSVPRNHDVGTTSPPAVSEAGRSYQERVAPIPTPVPWASVMECRLKTR